MSSEAELEGLRALAEKATPRPWVFKRDGAWAEVWSEGTHHQEWFPEGSGKGVHYAVVCVQADEGDDQDHDADLQLIVAAVNALPDLLDSLQSTRAALERAEAVGRQKGLEEAIEACDDVKRALSEKQTQALRNGDYGIEKRYIYRVEGAQVVKDELELRAASREDA